MKFDSHRKKKKRKKKVTLKRLLKCMLTKVIVQSLDTIGLVYLLETEKPATVLS